MSNLFDELSVAKKKDDQFIKAVLEMKLTTLLYTTRNCLHKVCESAKYPGNELKVTKEMDIEAWFLWKYVDGILWKIGVKKLDVAAILEAIRDEIVSFLKATRLAKLTIGHLGRLKLSLIYADRNYMRFVDFEEEDNGNSY